MVPPGRRRVSCLSVQGLNAATTAAHPPPLVHLHCCSRGTDRRTQRGLQRPASQRPTAAAAQPKAAAPPKAVVAPSRPVTAEVDGRDEGAARRADDISGAAPAGAPVVPPPRAVPAPAAPPAELAAEEDQDDGYQVGGGVRA